MNIQDRIIQNIGSPNSPNKTRVVVAMSGGVDSSVTAALLVEAGYEVIGITLQLYDHGMALKKKGACCAGQDIYDAYEVAEKLGIPHYVLNYESVFKQDVIDQFADSYLRGETPLPCVSCNQTVKFRDLLKAAKDLNADVLATGHYVKRVEGVEGPELHRATDEGKDQSYFLFSTTPEQMSYLRFPLGGLSKKETREHAIRLGLKIADKPDSQDICFVPNGKYSDLVKKLRPDSIQPGVIKHLDGRILGKHEGIVHFTIGQRRGLRLDTLNGEGPYYVIKIKPKEKEVIVGPYESLAKTEISLKDVNWITPLKQKEIEGHVKIRSTQEAIPARITARNDGKATVTLLRAEYGISSGQACVFYNQDQVLGGGWIQNV